MKNAPKKPAKSAAVKAAKPPLAMTAKPASAVKAAAKTAAAPQDPHDPLATLVRGRFARKFCGG